MIYLWYFYSKYYIIGAIFITYLLNKVAKKLYTAPLIINMVSFLLLLLIKEDRTYYMYFGYVPVVLASVIMNLNIYIYRKLKK